MLSRKNLPPGAVEATRDRSGRLVILTDRAMRHIAQRHPELDGCQLAITTAIENASFKCRGNADDREVLYAANLGPAAWLAVVVAYDHGKGGHVITAFGSNRGPAGGG
jgi:hypothetical protein